MIDETTFPIRSTWLLKSISQAPFVLLGAAVAVYQDQGRTGPGTLFVIFGGITVLVLVPNLTLAWLRKATFHFSLDDKFLTVRQGILKKQEKHVPYGVIQHVILKQDLLDRLFGLVTFAIENATRGADNEDGTQKIFGMKVKTPPQRGKVETIGFKGNRFSIPGLVWSDAEALKAVILGKMKENPLEDNQSGL